MTPAFDFASARARVMAAEPNLVRRPVVIRGNQRVVETLPSH